MSVYKKEELGLRTEVIYRLFLTFWDAILSCFSLFSHLKTNKSKTRLNQQYEIMITSIGENGSHVPCASRLLHRTNYSLCFLAVGNKAEETWLHLQMFFFLFFFFFSFFFLLFALLLLRINLQTSLNWNCITLQTSFEWF